MSRGTSPAQWTGSDRDSGAIPGLRRVPGKGLTGGSCPVLPQSRALPAGKQPARPWLPRPCVCQPMWTEHRMSPHTHLSPKEDGLCLRPRHPRQAPLLRPLGGDAVPDRGLWGPASKVRGSPGSPRPCMAQVLYLEPEKDSTGLPRGSPRTRARQYRHASRPGMPQPSSPPPRPPDGTGTGEAPREARSHAHRPPVGKGRAE